MRVPPFLPEEDDRLAALSEYGVSSDSMGAELDSIIDLASNLFDVPTVLVSLVERERQIFAARLGLDACETDRSVSFCAHALKQSDVLIVLDTILDPRFFDNPLVTGGPKIRFYAGAPLIAPSGFSLGSFCIIDIKPHNTFSQSDQRNLKDLAALVLDKMELRRLNIAQHAPQMRFEQIAATSPDGIICTDHKGVISFWNRAAIDIFGYTAEEIAGKSIETVLPYPVRHRRVDDPIKEGDSETPHEWVGKTVELKACRKDGSEFLTELSLSTWHDGEMISYGAIVRDITERRSNEDRLFRLAHLDSLTNLPNRMVLRNRIAQAAETAAPVSVIVLDLDGFKDVNDTLGHCAGDTLLTQVAERLLHCVRSIDTVARMGGDEFALLLPDVGGAACAAVADTAISALSAPFLLGGQAIHVGASAGIASWPLNSASVQELLSNADLALYLAKAEGKHCRRIFTPLLRQAAFSRRAYEGELRQAFDNEDFEIFYQPQIRLIDGALVGAEALLRWRHPQQGLILPGAFMPALETGLLAAHVGHWVLEKACAQAALWRRLVAPDFRMGVNLFGAQFRTGDLAERVRAVLAKEKLAPAALELEITENIILRHDDAMLGPLRELHDDGVGITFDDYGTGYASLSMLKRYPLTRLKIDRSFIQGICTSPEDAAIVRAILHLGRSFGLAVIAEGVETEEQCERLRKKGCEEVQGFLFGKPLPASEFEARFMRKQALRGLCVQNDLARVQ